jgi:mono/diheme cytochrome c family protein
VRIVVTVLAGLMVVGCGQGGGTGASAGAGEQVFTSEGCGGCHTLEAASSSAAVGPDLDEALADTSRAFIRESILEPGRRVEPGFADVMPKDYDQRLSARQLDQLVDFLVRTAGR